MEVRPIRTDKDHKAALAQIASCWGAPERSERGNKLDVLVALVDIYQAPRSNNCIFNENFARLVHDRFSVATRRNGPLEI
jgi:hypothetical protein